MIPFEPGDDLSIIAANNRDGYARFKEKADKLVPRPLPDFHGGKVDGGSLVGMIWFDLDWKPKSFAFDTTG